MFAWIPWKKRKKQSGRRLKSRAEMNHAEQVELSEFAPDMRTFLGLTAYLELELYEAATRAVSGAPDLAAKDVLARVAGETLAKQQRLAGELRKRGEEPAEVMAPFQEFIERYVARVDTTDWYQHVLSLYLVGGLFDEFFASLAEGIRDSFKSEAIALLREDSGRKALQELLAAALADNQRLSSWLAVWGRRLVGDTLLVSRRVLSLSAHREFDASEVEPVFTELIAEHIRRMDRLGLTA